MALKIKVEITDTEDNLNAVITGGRIMRMLGSRYDLPMCALVDESNPEFNPNQHELDKCALVVRVKPAG